MRNRMVVPLIAVLGVALGAAACTSTAPSGPGVWGSDQALLAVEGRIGADAADALAIALCHAQHRSGRLNGRRGTSR